MNGAYREREHVATLGFDASPLLRSTRPALRRRIWIERAVCVAIGAVAMLLAIGIA